MAYSDAAKHEARARYIAGESFEAIARALSEMLGVNVHVSVPWRWHKKKVLGDWDQAREEVREKAKAEIQERLTRERAQAAINHFDDIDTVRRMWKQQLFVSDPNQPDGVMRDEEKRPIPKQFTPRDFRSLVGAYAGIVGIERTILGQDIYNVPGTGKKGDFFGADEYGDLPGDMVEKIETMLVGAFSDPGEKLEDEDEAERAEEARRAAEGDEHASEPESEAEEAVPPPVEVPAAGDED